MNLVSVIIPAYNPGPYLQETLASLRDQTYSDWEAIVVDDGSKEDVSASIPDDPRIILVRQENQGVAAARNAGIARSRGDLIAFLDADDLWKPTKLERQVAVMRERPEVGLCHTSFHHVDAQGQYLMDGYQGFDRDYLDLLGGCGIALSTTMIRRECLDKVGLFDVTLPPLEDYDLWLRISQHFALARIESIEALYRLHGSNATKNYMKMYRQQTKVQRKHLDAANERNDTAVRQAAKRGLQRTRHLYSSQAFDRARADLKRRVVPEGMLHLRNALLLSPGYVVGQLGRQFKKSASSGG